MPACRKFEWSGGPALCNHCNFTLSEHPGPRAVPVVLTTNGLNLETPFPCPRYSTTAIQTPAPPPHRQPFDNTPILSSSYPLLCGECRREVATVVCRQCRERYCSDCSYAVHKKGRRQEHTDIVPMLTMSSLVAPAQGTSPLCNRVSTETIKEEFFPPSHMLENIHDGRLLTMTRNVGKQLQSLQHAVHGQPQNCPSSPIHAQLELDSLAGKYVDLEVEVRRRERMARDCNTYPTHLLAENTRVGNYLPHTRMDERVYSKSGFNVGSIE